MTDIGVTGINGLIGWHLRAFLYSRKDFEIVTADRLTFSSKESLDNFVKSSDVIVHLASMITGDEKVLAETNIKLVDDLLGACERMGRAPHIIFASSNHILRNTAYGRSKTECSERFAEWSEINNAKFTNLILPNVFGEGGKPFYNSVISTFCHQKANGEECKIMEDITLEQRHAQDVARKIFDIIRNSITGDIFFDGHSVSVSAILDKLNIFSDKYQKHIIPELKTNFDLALFNTYRSYLYPGKYPMSVPVHEDKRGSLFETVKSLNGGQTFISTTRPRVVRGNHYHLSKFERFFVISGNGEIRIRKLFSDKIRSFYVSGARPEYIDIPTLHTHSITNVGDEKLTVLFWSHELFDPDKSDTFEETV